MLTKSGLMVGLGESTEELLETMQDIRDTNCDLLTVGQYLSPTSRHLPIQRYYTPEEFEDLKICRYGDGISACGIGAARPEFVSCAGAGTIVIYRGFG